MYKHRETPAPRPCDAVAPLWHLATLALECYSPAPSTTVGYRPVPRVVAGMCVYKCLDICTLSDFSETNT